MAHRATSPSEEIPSLYPIDATALLKAEPTLIITQDLCEA